MSAAAIDGHEIEDDGPLPLGMEPPKVMGHIVIKSRVNGIAASTLIDEGSNSSFISTHFAHQHKKKLKIFPLTQSRSISGFDGKAHSRITHMALLDLEIGEGKDLHKEQWMVFIGDLKYDICLGRPWHATHRPEIHHDTGVVIMNSDHCAHQCLHGIKAAVGLAPESRFKGHLDDSADPEGVLQVSALTVGCMAQRPDHEVFVA